MAFFKRFGFKVAEEPSIVCSEKELDEMREERNRRLEREQREEKSEDSK